MSVSEVCKKHEIWSAHLGLTTRLLPLCKNLSLPLPSSLPPSNDSQDPSLSPSSDSQALALSLLALPAFLHTHTQAYTPALTRPLFCRLHLRFSSPRAFPWSFFSQITTTGSLLSFMSDMGTGEMGAPSKTTKTSTPQEQPPSTAPMSYPEWAAAFQAYYGSAGTTPLPPPGYFPSTVGSGPQPHPYMWGAQPLMPPYGTPPPYAAMYPHGGIYAHPSMPHGTHPYSPYALAAGNANEVQGNATSICADGEGKSGDGKAKSSMKRSKGSLGSLGMLTGKGNEAGKGTPGPMNGTFSHSHDSGSEGSTEGSEGNSQYGSDGGRLGSLDQVTSEAPVANSTPYGRGQEVNHGGPVAAIPISIAGKQVVGAGPLTNLNIGMDYWSGGAPAVLASSRGKRGSAAATTTAIIPSGVGPGRDGVPGELWKQDERELKRQRRKQSNRESARRSRLRKQAECEELAARVDALDRENLSLRSELTRITEQCNKLSAENSSLMAQLQIRGIQPEPTTEGVLDRNGSSHLRGERRDIEGGLQVDNEHFRRDAREANDTFAVANEGGNLAVSVSSG